MLYLTSNVFILQLGTEVLEENCKVRGKKNSLLEKILVSLI